MQGLRSIIQSRRGTKDAYVKLALSLFLIVSGFALALVPRPVFNLILEISIIYFSVNAVYLFYLAFTRRRGSDFFYAVLSVVFSLVLSRYATLPVWFIRVSFGGYCLLSSLANFIQYILYRMNDVKNRVRLLIFSVIYGIFGAVLLFRPKFPADLLLSFFGVYFSILGFRYLFDALDALYPNANYAWKRRIRVNLPPFIAVFLPDRALSSINRYLMAGEEYDLEEIKTKEEPLLKIMVFTGSTAFKKVGHCCFAYKGIVYSYGNYDAESYRMANLLGDGCYFCVPIDYYQQNMLAAENNSIFEYGIHLTKGQERKIDRQIESLKRNSYRWYCRLEREDGYLNFEKYKKDYPSRLHYRTGAKFYKIKKGKFKYYWFIGDNCASFLDEILGTVGADILSMRGFITPGTYYDFLQNEYLKENSPVISRTIRPYIPEQLDRL